MAAADGRTVTRLLRAKGSIRQMEINWDEQEWGDDTREGLEGERKLVGCWEESTLGSNDLRGSEEIEHARHVQGVTVDDSDGTNTCRSEAWAAAITQLFGG